MHKSTQVRKETKEPQFVKGMTLNQYLASYPEYAPQGRDNKKEEKQEDLFQSSHYRGIRGLQSRDKPSRIEEIDQESIQDSVDYNKPGKVITTPTFKHHGIGINETNEETLLPQKKMRSKINSLSMSGRQNLKMVSQEKNIFKIKKMSMSPSKRKNEQVLVNGSVTLYGNKFGKVTKREEIKMPELLTFYGKLSLEKQQGKIKQKTTMKASDMRQNFKKKNPLELKELLVIQNKIKSNYSLVTNNQEIMVLGIKDKLLQRRQRHLQ